jgi:hypothetical protein
MKNIKFLNTLKSDFKRSFCSPKFFIAVLLIPIMCFVILGNDIVKSWLQEDKNHIYTSDTLYYLDLLFNFSQFRQILLVISAIPFVTSFCNDWNNKYVMPLAVRSGIKRYSISKITTIFLSSFAVIFLGLTIFILIISINSPFINLQSGNTAYMIIEKNFYGDILKSSPLMLFITRLSITAVSSASWCTFALTVSALLPNKFLALGAPFIGFYFYNIILIFIPQNISKFFDADNLPGASQLISENSYLNLLYVYSFFSVTSIICGIVFHNIVKRRLGNELV